MKNKKILLILSLIGLMSCGEGTSSNSLESSNGSSSVSSSESSSLNSSTMESTSSSLESSSISSSEISSEESSSSISTSEELTLTLLANGEINNEGIYEIKVFSTLQLIPTFNDSSRSENVTYTTKEGIFNSTSTNVSIDENGILTALSKSDIITVTCTSTSGLTSSIRVKVYAEMDNYYSSLTNLLTNSLEKEKSSLNHGEFVYEKQSNGVISKKIDTIYDVFNNNSLEAHEKDASNNENYIFSGMYNGKYYYVKKDASNNYVDVRSKDNDLSNASNLYQINLTSMNSFYGISALCKYYLTDSSYLGDTSAYNHASIVKTNDNYVINSSFESASFFSNYYYEYNFKLEFSNVGELIGVTFNKKTYDSNGYDFSNHVIKENGTIYSEENAIAILDYDDRENASSTFSVNELFLTSYDVVIKNKLTSVIATSFEVDTVLSFEYGDNFAPSTAYKDLDKLSFVSSSNENVINLNENNELVCLMQGESTLLFTSSGGVEKSVTITVTFSGITGIELSSNIKEISKVKVGKSVENISATTIPHLASQEYSIAISKGQEFASLTKQENGTYTLLGIASGEITITASTTYNGETFNDSYSLTIYESLSDAQIKEKLNNHTYTYEKVDVFGNTTKHTLSFTELTGTYVTSSYTISFDYNVIDGEIVLSNMTSNSSSYTLLSLILNDDASQITSTISEKSMFGTYTYNYILKY